MTKEEFLRAMEDFLKEISAGETESEIAAGFKEQSIGDSEALYRSFREDPLSAGRMIDCLFALEEVILIRCDRISHELDYPLWWSIHDFFSSWDKALFKLNVERGDAIRRAVEEGTVEYEEDSFERMVEMQEWNGPSTTRTSLKELEKRLGKFEEFDEIRDWEE